MQVITTTKELKEFCDQARNAPFITVDTEFLREKTYYSKLCLVQLATPLSEDSAIAVDVLSSEMSLEPLYELFQDKAVVKVFHAARQDIEIFYHQAGLIPDPFFDTQIAAMVCGYGDQVGYDKLVQKICKSTIDKTSRFTNWSQRPLDQKQISYALSDVTYLRDIYMALKKELKETGRSDWVTEETAILTNPETYELHPEDAWRRVKMRSHNRRFIAIIRELAKWREEQAQRKDRPRNRIMKDEALLELGALRPTSSEMLKRARLLPPEYKSEKGSEAIIAAVGKALALDEAALPALSQKTVNRNGNEALLDLLKVLLKAKSYESKVAQKLIATSDDLDQLIDGDHTGLPILSGWRYEVFGKDAMKLLKGEIALTFSGKAIKTLKI